MDTGTTANGLQFNEVGGIDNATMRLRRVLAHMLQSYFQQQAEINNLRWDPIIEKTEIFIAEEYPSDTEGRDLRPAIIIERGPFKRSAVGLGDDRVSLDLRMDIEKKTWIVSGQISFHCISRFGLESEAIAWAVHDLIMFYKRDLSARARLHHVGDSIIGKESPYKPQEPEWDGWFDVPVTIEFFLERTLTLEHTPLRTLDALATANT